jgi:ribosomal protein S9
MTLLPLGLILAALLATAAVTPAQGQTPSPTERLLEAKRGQEQQGQAAPQAGARAQGGDVVVVQATGVGSWRLDDAARSRDEALEAAQRSAVEDASGILITSESQMRNFELVQDEVLSRSKGFIRSYKVLKEGQDGAFYNVTIQAEVVKSAFMNDLNQSLEDLYRRVGKPRVMLVVEEGPAGGASGAGDASGTAVAQGLNVVEKEVRKILLKQGFTFIDARALSSGSLIEKAEKGRTASRESLLDLARTTKAELVMIGRGQISSRNRLQKFYIVEATVGLDVVRTDNGQVMASEVSTAKGLNINEDTAVIAALQKAAEEITPKIMEQVTYQWIREKNEGGSVELVVKNVSYGDLLLLRKILSNDVRGVKKVRQRSYSGGVALLELVTRDPPERIAESLFETKFETFALDIQDVTANSLVVSLKKR